MTASNLAAAQAYTKRLERLTEDDLHAEGFQVVKAAKAELASGESFTAYDQLVLLYEELARRTRCERRITRKQITQSVAKTMDVPYEHLTGRSRSARIAAARCVAMSVIRQRMRLSSTEIGDFFQRDHSTVLHALQRVEDDPELRAIVQQVGRSL